ncbi:hypothetical protein GQ53DRAFT_839847 [Thozetella sp. PMI_491]|nr:hypothetical protein GQ53DRAFT_839847 [Thozetella sp. PMI_491]
MTTMISCLSQMNRNWFHRDPRPLADFELFDSASRGVWGSLSLLCKFKWSLPANLAAFVTIMNLFSSSVTQMLITYLVRLAPAVSLAASQGAQQYVVGDPHRSLFDPLYIGASFGSNEDDLNPVQPLVAEAYVCISWAWLAFPATQLLLSIVVLILTVAETTRLQTKVFKTSSLATLTALDHKSRAMAGAIVGQRDLRKRASWIHVRFDGDQLALCNHQTGYEF